jgi:hypothetical protein
MIKLSKTSGICIPRKFENNEWYERIKIQLTRHSKEYQTSLYVTNYFYLEGTNILKIPRFFPVEDYISKFQIVDGIPDGQDININHNIELRDDLQKNIVDYMLNNKNGIIQANPGSGKTVVSIYAAATFKKKTFILVHRTNLIDQWKNGFLKYTDIKEDQIGIFSSLNFKDDFTKDIIICTDQTFTSLLRRNRNEFLKELNLSKIGLFIADEVHTSVGAPTFAECSIHIPSKLVFGLSATPKRWDGNSDVIEYHLGKVFIPDGKSSIMDARINVILFNFGFLPKSYKYIYWGGYFQKSRYLTILKNSKIFLEVCKSLIDKFVKDKRKILLVGERIKLLDLLFANNKCQDKGKFYGSAGLDQIENQVTYATPGKSRDGIDFVDKDCIILTSPISNIEQMTGRALRIKDGKSEPIIIDLVDIGVKEISQTLFSRLEFYKRKEWNIKYIFVSSNGNKRELLEDEVIQIIKQENKSK